VPGSPLRQRIRLRSEPTAPRRARDFLGAVCAGWNEPGFVDTGGLLVSELVSNAVLHARTPVEVLLQLADGRLLIQVHDDGSGVPAVVPAANRVIGGNGLDIVSRLAESWGVTPDGPGDADADGAENKRAGGKSVWCVILPDPVPAGNAAP